VCDVAEACNGVDDACPADGFVPASLTCRGSSAACDPSETCTGVSPLCPADVACP
jgi:hypothetical protein